MKAKLVTLGDRDHLAGLRVEPSASSLEIVGEAEEASCERIVKRFGAHHSGVEKSVPKRALGRATIKRWLGPCEDHLAIPLACEFGGRGSL